METLKPGWQFGDELPAYREYVYPTLQAVKARGGSATIGEIEDAVAEAMGVPAALLALPHGNTARTEFQYKLAWVRTHLKKVDALHNSERGVWSITDYGETLTEQEARQVFKRVQSEWRVRGQESEDVDSLPVDGPDAEGSWVEKLLEIVGMVSPDAFERLCQRLLRESGFTKVEVTGRPSDGGIDGIGVLRMNLVSFQVLFQCKRWKGSVGAPVVRDFRGAMVGRADKGLIITTGTFTSDARREATRDGAPAIDLIDGETLCQLLKERRLGVNVRMVEEVAVEAIFFQSI